MAGRKKKTTHSSGLLRKRITVGHDANGKAINPPIYAKSPEELKEKEAELRVKYGMGIDVTKDKSTWEYWASAWKSLTKPTVRPATWLNYETALKHLSVLNPQKINAITSIDLEMLLANHSNYSKRILVLLLGTASRVFRLAKKNRVIMFDPTEDVKIPQGAVTSPREAISPEVELLLWDLRPLPYSNQSDKERGEKLLLMRMFALMELKCGLRREEVIPLKWNDIDLDAGTVTINKAYSFKDKEIKSPKSKAGYRSVIIPDDYLSELKAWKVANKGTLAGSIWVFPYRGKMITESEFINLWNVLLDGINHITLSDRIREGQKKSKAPKEKEKKTGRRLKMERLVTFTSHQLRHTYATNCIAKGIDVRTVQYLMGHATAQMTMDYTHPSASAIGEARAKINAVSKSKSQKKA